MFKSRVLSRINLLTVFVFFSILSQGYCQDWGKINDSERLLGAPEDFPEANVIIIFDNGKMEVKPDAILFHRHVRAKILNKAGIDEIGDITIAYHEEDKIRGLKAHTIDTRGKKHKVGKKKFYTKSSGKWKYKSFAFPSLDSGCIVEYKYTNSNERFYNLDSWEFHNEFYTLKSKFNAILWPGFNYTTAVTNMTVEQQQAKVDKLSNMDQPNLPLISYTWEMQDLPPIKDEPYMSFIGNYMSSISSQIVSYQYLSGRVVEFVKGWEDLGQRIYDMIQEYVDKGHKGIEKDKVLNGLVDSLTANLDGNMEKAEAIYGFVKDKIKEKYDSRYQSNESLAELLDTRVGTGDEKNILLIEMCKRAGIPVWPVLIGNRNSKLFNPKIYHLDQFDHIIAKAEIDMSPIFIDASYEYYPFGILPRESRVRGGCLIEDNNSHVIAVSYSDPISLKKEYIRMHYNNDGTVSCSTSIELSGYSAAWYAERYEDSEPAEFVNDYFLDDLESSYELTSSNFDFDNQGTASFSFTYDLEDYAEQLDNNALITPIRYYFRENPFNGEKRFFPIDFNFPRQYSSMVEITYDDAIEGYECPEAKELKIQGARYSRNCMFDGSKVIVVNSLFIDTPVFPQALYPTTREFFDNIASYSKDNVILTFESK